MEVRKRKKETNESLIRRFVRKVKKEKIIEEYREREHFKKPSEVRRERNARRQIELEKQNQKEQRENKD
jgi:ribosomal protein S21